MPGPTLVDYDQSTWSDTSTASEVTTSASWSANDVVVVLGATGDNVVTLGVPTATGLTFAALAGTPTNTASNCKLYAWSATAGSSGSGVITSTTDGASEMRGLASFVHGGSNGIGNTSIATGLGATTTQSLIRSQGNSAVIQVWGDWNAVNDVAVTWTPAGETERVAQWISAKATMFVASWGGQGDAGTTSYGFTGGSATAMSAITVEILGLPNTVYNYLLFPKPKLRR